MDRKPRKARPREGAQERRAMLDPKKVEHMLAVLVRNPAAHEAVRHVLKIEHLRQIGDGYALAWKTACKFFDAYAELPDLDQLRTEMHNALGGREDILTSDEGVEIDEWLEYAYDPAQIGATVATSQVHARSAIDTCKLFIEQQEAIKLSEAVFSSETSTMPVRIHDVLQASQATYEQISTLTAAPAAPLFEEGWDTEPQPPMLAFGIPFIDNFLCGGACGEEVIGAMGPFGSCKTTLAVQAACNLAQTAAYRFGSEESGGKHEVAVLISTEMGVREARQRVLSYLAAIPRTRIAAMTSLDDLCTADRPGATKETKYELKRLKRQIRQNEFMCERDRAEYATGVINSHMLFIDCTPSNKANPQAGSGGVREVSAMVAAEVRRRGIAPLAFVLDHASALANRMVGHEGSGLTTDDLRHVVKNIPLQCRDLLGKRYGAPTLVMHQLSGAANSARPTADLDHTDAAECKSFGEFLDYAVILGRPTDDDLRLARARCTKFRRSPPKPWAIIRIDGAFARVLDVTKYYTIDFNRGMFVARSERELQAEAASSAEQTPTQEEGTERANA